MGSGPGHLVSAHAFRIHAVVCGNALPYFQYLVQNARELASRHAEIAVVAHCTDADALRTVTTDALADVVVEVNAVPLNPVGGRWWFPLDRLRRMRSPRQTFPGSSRHAAGLNSAFRMTGGSYDVIADCDTVIVAPQWDTLLVSVLSEVGIVGAAYEDIGGFSSGRGRRQTYKRLPNVTWVALSPAHDFRALDASHGLDRAVPIRTPEQAALYNLPIGSELLRDVGWQLPSYLAARDIRALAMVHVKPSSADARVLHGTSDYHEEFHLRGRPFLVHQRGSRKHPFRSMPLSAPFYAALESYLRNLGAPASTDTGAG
ncbi:MAG: hypothetical protein ACRDGN_04960 [bacterium]